MSHLNQRQSNIQYNDQLLSPTLSFIPSTVSNQKRVLINIGDNLLNVPSPSHRSSSNSHSNSFNQTAKKGILKIIKYSPDTRDQSMNLQQQNGSSTNHQSKENNSQLQHQRSNSDQRNGNLDKTKLLTPLDRYYPNWEGTGKEKSPAFTPQIAQSLDQNLKKAEENSKSVIFTPLKSRIVSQNNQPYTRNGIEGPLLLVNDKIPFNFHNINASKNDNIQGDNKMNSTLKSEQNEFNRSFLSKKDLQEEKFQHSSRYLQRRTGQIESNKSKEEIYLSVVKEDITSQEHTKSLSHINNPLISFNPLEAQDQQKENAKEKETLPAIKQFQSLNYQNIDINQRKRGQENSYYQGYMQSQSDNKRASSVNNYSFQDNIVTQTEQVNRKKYRLLERLKKKTSPNQFHYEEHYQNILEDDKFYHPGPYPTTHPRNNIYDLYNPLREFYVKSNLPLANQNIVTNPQTYTHQSTCHNHIKKQKNQERLVGLLEQQDQMMNRLINKYKKKADQEESLLEKKLLTLKKDRNELVILKSQENKLAHLQSNMSSKLDQYKKNVSFYNENLSPKMPALRSGMYDEQTDMYDLEFLNSLMNRNLDVEKGIKRKVTETKRSRSMMN